MPGSLLSQANLLLNNHLKKHAIHPIGKFFFEIRRLPLYICHSIFCFSIIPQNPKTKNMNNTLSTLERESVQPFTHIFLSLDLMESNPMSEEFRDCINIIRRNTERLEQLIKEWQPEDR
jgi:hypothetical protein